MLWTFHVAVGSGTKNIAECSNASIIGRNTGVYMGGLPPDFIIQREETEDRAQVMCEGDELSSS